MGFPRIGPKKLSAAPLAPLAHRDIDAATTFFKAIPAPGHPDPLPLPDLRLPHRVSAPGGHRPQGAFHQDDALPGGPQFEDRQRADQRLPKRQEGHGGDGSCRPGSTRPTTSTGRNGSRRKGSGSSTACPASRCTPSRSSSTGCRHRKDRAVRQRRHRQLQRDHRTDLHG